MKVNNEKILDNAWWQQKWQEGNIGFHLDGVNELLLKYFEDIYSNKIESLKNKSAFVPLCGKSLDILYLSKYFNIVEGLDCSQIALDNFFNENNISYKKENKLYSSEKINLYLDDIFKFKPKHKYDFIYDRAASIAMNQNRNKYHDYLKSILSPDGQILLIGLKRDTKQGPPFDMEIEQVKKNFSDFKIQILEEKKTLFKGKQLAVEYVLWLKK